MRVHFVALALGAALCLPGAQAPRARTVNEVGKRSIGGER
jgi:hypothetical protein